MAVHNDFWFPIPHIRLHYQTIDSQLNDSPESFTAVLLPRGHGEQTLSIHCRYRGRWDVGLTHVELEDFFGLFRVPQFTVENRDASRFYEHWHIYAAYALLALIALHVLAALYHRVIKKDGVLERMVDGRAR